MALDQVPDIPHQKETIIEAKAPSFKHAELPDYLQSQIDELLNKTCESKDELKEEIKIESVYKALENKYGEAFNRCNFEIKRGNFTQKEIDYFGFDIFLIFSKEGKLLSYIDQSGETKFNMENFVPFVDSFGKTLINKKLEIDFQKNEEERWIMIYKGEEYEEGSERFNYYIISREIL